MAAMCSTAASPCRFPFTWKGSEYHGCTRDGVEQYHWCALEVDAEGELVADRWGVCDMDACAAKEVQEEVQPLAAVAEFIYSASGVIGVVRLTQRAPDNPLQLQGLLDNLPEGHFKLGVGAGPCGAGVQQEGGVLGETIGSDGNSSSYVSCEEWSRGLYSGEDRPSVVGRSLLLRQGECGEACAVIACADIVLKSVPGDHMALIIVIIAAVAVLLLLLVVVTVYCCCRRR